VTHTPTILIIDPDAAAAQELHGLLEKKYPASRIIVSPDIQTIKNQLSFQSIQWLFIRIICFDDFQQVTYKSRHQHPPPKTIFLSSATEKCTGHLDFILDGHLQAPYRPGRLGKVMKKMSDPAFIPQPLDFFFLKYKARYTPIHYHDLYQVQQFKRELWIETRQTEYRITASLAAFQARLPIPLTRIRRGWLVNEAYTVGPPEPKPHGFLPSAKTPLHRND
jgi:DNA-binding LytR/AlgR family response regulator